MLDLLDKAFKSARLKILKEPKESMTAELKEEKPEAVSARSLILHCTQISTQNGLKP